MVNDQRLREYPPTRFREATLAVIEREGRVESRQAPFLVAAALGLSYRDFDPSRNYQVNPLDARVRAALNGLATARAIVKVPRGELQPGGCADKKHALYYSRSRFAADTTAERQQSAQEAEVTQRWESITERLRDLGILMQRKRVPLAAWEDKVLPALEAYASGRA